MTDSARHPARSPEFLSRLHDGDLSAAERVQFESHRAHCAACRGAAAEFETALALYRSNRPGPPASDLSARILRRLQATSPRRSPLGVTFGVDLRWAGAFVAALLAVLVGSSIVVRRETEARRLTRESAPIPIVLQRDEREGSSLQQKPLSKAPPQAGSNEPSRAAPLARKSTSENLKELAIRGQAVASATPPLPPALLDREAGANQESEPREASGGRAATGLETPRALRRAESGSPGGREQAVGAGTPTAPFASDALSARAHLVIVPIDSAGAAPSLVGGDEVDLPEPLRGHDFVLAVEADGRVREVKPADTEVRRKTLAERDVNRVEAVSLEAQRPLRELRFQPGERPRLLRVRVE